MLSIWLYHVHLKYGLFTTVAQETIASTYALQETDNSRSQLTPAQNMLFLQPARTNYSQVH